MQRDNSDEIEGQDAFLDVIANVVGVLIILVMVVGVHASQSALRKRNEVADHSAETSQPSKPQAAIASSSAAPNLAKSDLAKPNLAKPNLAKLSEALDAAKREAISTENKIVDMVRQTVTIARNASLLDQNRIELNMHHALVSEDLERRRSLLDETQQQQYDVQANILQSRLRLDELMREQLTLAQAPTEVEEIECVPTPLGKTVDGAEIHLRLRKGLISIVPVDALHEEVLRHVDNIRRRLQGRNEVVEVFGPIDGYRLRFRARKESVVVAAASAALPSREQIHIDQRSEYFPSSESMGQNVQQALLPGSVLMSHLATHRRQATPVTIWAYNDSFEELRELRRTLWEMGFPVAIRPLTPKDRIASSPRGSKSVAQ